MAARLEERRFSIQLCSSRITTSVNWGQNNYTRHNFLTTFPRKSTRHFKHLLCVGIYPFRQMFPYNTLIWLFLSTVLFMSIEGKSWTVLLFNRLSLVNDVILLNQCFAGRHWTKAPSTVGIGNANIGFGNEVLTSRHFDTSFIDYKKIDLVILLTTAE